MALRVGVEATGRDLLRWATDLVRSRPELALAVLLGAVVLLGAGWLLLRWYRRPAGERLRRLLAGEESVTVLLHPNPDPDAMAAGLGVKHLATVAGTEATIQFPGEIRHQENRAFRTILDLDLGVIQSAEDLEGDAVVLVDHNQARGFDGAERVDPIAVVDHHPGDGTGVSFTDVRPEYGACATIVAEFLDQVGLEPVPPEHDAEEYDAAIPTSVTTGMLYGILADTNHLTKGCTDAEFDAAAFLYPGVDQELLDRIANPQVDAEVLDVQSRAIQEREVDGPFAVSFVGEVSNVDSIPQAADELLRLEGVTAVVVGGRKSGTLHLSGRSRDDRVHMGRALERAVEDIPQSGAGGHARMGGGQISLAHMEGLGPGSGVSIEEFTERLFRSMGGEELATAE